MKEICFPDANSELPRFYEFQVTATDKAGNPSGTDMCRILVMPKKVDEYSIFGGAGRRMRVKGSSDNNDNENETTSRRTKSKSKKLTNEEKEELFSAAIDKKVEASVKASSTSQASTQAVFEVFGPFSLVAHS
jgi:hypothetical protein